MIDIKEHEYKISLSKGGLYKEFDACRLGICIGEPDYEGNKLKALLEWVDKRFQVCHVYLFDTVQRHNFIEPGHRGGDEPSKAAYDKSVEEAKAWLARHKKLIDGLSTVTIFHRWEDFLSDPAYESSHAAISELYRTNEAFRESVEADASRFAQSERMEDVGEFFKEQLAKQCASYLLEEIAAFAIMAEQLPGIEIYSGSELESTKIFKEQDMEGAPEALKNRAFYRVHLKRKKGPTPASQEAPTANAPSTEQLYLHWCRDRQKSA